MMTGKFKLISDLFAANGLTDGYTVQNLSFFDSGDLSERFIVFRPAGGGNIDAIISSEHYVDVVCWVCLGLFAFQTLSPC